MSVQQPETRATLRQYTIGFGVSLLLTLVAYVLVSRKVLEGGALIAAIVGLAVIQLMAQLYFFLHLGQETKPRWRMVMFFFMIMVLAIVVLGSLWIMQNLNYHMMPAHEMNVYIMQDEGIHR